MEILKKQQNDYLNDRIREIDTKVYNLKEDTN